MASLQSSRWDINNHNQDQSIDVITLDQWLPNFVQWCSRSPWRIHGSTTRWPWQTFLTRSPGHHYFELCTCLCGSKWRHLGQLGTAVTGLHDRLTQWRSSLHWQTWDPMADQCSYHGVSPTAAMAPIGYRSSHFGIAAPTGTIRLGCQKVRPQSWPWIQLVQAPAPAEECCKHAERHVCAALGGI